MCRRSAATASMATLIRAWGQSWFNFLQLICCSFRCFLILWQFLIIVLSSPPSLGWGRGSSAALRGTQPGKRFQILPFFRNQKLETHQKFIRPETEMFTVFQKQKWDTHQQLFDPIRLLRKLWPHNVRLNGLVHLQHNECKIFETLAHWNETKGQTTGVSMVNGDIWSAVGSTQFWGNKTQVVERSFGAKPPCQSEMNLSNGYIMNR